MTLEDVASHVGLSRSAVSLAFTGKNGISSRTRERILQAARELGYQPNPHAQRLAGGVSTTIGLFSLDLDFGVVTHKIKIIQRLLTEKGFNVPLYAHGAYAAEDEQLQTELMATLINQQPRAIICSTRDLKENALLALQDYANKGGVVVCYDYRSDLDCDRVIFDREDNNYQTARHLLDLGHRALGLYMEGPHVPSGERLHGFERALREQGIATNENWMFYGGVSEAGGVELAHQFLALKERPTGICIVNDRAASAFINQVSRAGVRVPEDLSVIGHDDQPAAASCFVPLTTNTHPVEIIAQTVVDLLCSRLDGSYDGPARERIVRGNLMQRASTDAPP